MRRRGFIAFLIGAGAWPLTTYAQQLDQLRRIGVFINLASDDPEMLLRLAALRKGLQALGWIEGRNLQIDIHQYSGDVDQIRAAAAELVGLKPDAIFVYGPPGVSGLRRVTQTIPIVFVQVSNAIGAGFVANMSRPGGNITGFTSNDILVGGKWLEVLKEIAPGVARCAIIGNPDNPGQGAFLGAIEAAATTLKVQTAPIVMRDTSDKERRAMENAVEGFARQPNGGMLVLPDFATISLRHEMAALAAKHRLPAIYPFRYFALAGGLVSYGVDQIEQTRQAAPYLDRILKGENPGDLPVQAPTKFELVINMKAAKALSLPVPPSLVARADELIE